MVVTLILKCDLPSAIKYLKPISLCNVVYKILSKVLCNQLKIVLPDLVDKSQSVFVFWHSIQDKILNAFELIHTMKKNKGEVREMAVKIDISKAYGRVDWSYLEAILRCLGFGEMWIGWRMMCV